MTTRVITVCNEKGGVGKSTTVGELATVCAQSGKRVLVIDADKQATMDLWVGLAESAQTEVLFDLATLEDPSDLDHVTEIAADYDLVFIDTPGSLAQRDLVKAYLRISDFIVMVSEMDLAALYPADRYIDELITPLHVPYSVLLAKCDNRSRGDIEAALEFLNARQRPTFSTYIPYLRAVPQALRDGQFVTGTNRITAGIRRGAEAYRRAAVDLLTSIATL